MGSITLAEKMIKAAKNSGADYANFKHGELKILNLVHGIKMEEDKFMKKQN